MKKDKLIKMLQDIPGNPDIVLWNGMVGDWMDISPKPIEQELVKQSFDHFVRHVEFERKRDKNDFDYKLPAVEVEKLKSSYRRHYSWELNEFVTEDDITSGSYKAKRVVVINAKPRGVSTWDRLGKIEY
jgi:hypothetical protein